MDLRLARARKMVSEQRTVRDLARIACSPAGTMPQPASMKPFERILRSHGVDLI